MPIRMIGAVVRNEPFPEEFYEAKEDIFCGDSVSITDIISSDYGTSDSEHTDDDLDGMEGYDSEDFVVPEEELEKIRLLLKGREEIAMELVRNLNISFVRATGSSENKPSGRREG